VHLTDEWELADVHDKSVVLFTPADIDNAVGLLTRPQHAAAIEELDSDSNDGTVDEIIERNSYQLADSAASSYGFDSSLFTVAARLLKPPGVQREIVTAALSDPEVFDILAAKIDLPGYLGSQGLAARGLLPSSDSDGASSSAMQVAVQDRTSAQADNSSGTSLLDDVSAWAADQVEGLGFAVVRLGRWMRGKLSGQQQEEKARSGSGAEAGADPAFMRRVGGGTLAAVMVAMVAIISIVLLKKPVTLRRLSQVMRAK